MMNQNYPIVTYLQLSPSTDIMDNIIYTVYIINNV